MENMFICSLILFCREGRANITNAIMMKTVSDVVANAFLSVPFEIFWWSIAQVLAKMKSSPPIFSVSDVRAKNENGMSHLGFFSDLSPEYRLSRTAIVRGISISMSVC